MMIDRPDKQDSVLLVLFSVARSFFPSFLTGTTLNVIDNRYGT